MKVRGVHVREGEWGRCVEVREAGVGRWAVVTRVEMCTVEVEYIHTLCSNIQLDPYTSHHTQFTVASHHTQLTVASHHTQLTAVSHHTQLTVASHHTQFTVVSHHIVG